MSVVQSSHTVTHTGASRNGVLTLKLKNRNVILCGVVGQTTKQKDRQEGKEATT